MTTVLLHTGQTAPKLEPRQPEVRVVRGGKHGLNRARQFASVALHVIAVALLLGMIFSVVHSQARITELNGQINDTRTDLTAAQSEYDYLSTKMSDITSRASLRMWPRASWAWSRPTRARSPTSSWKNRASLRKPAATQAAFWRASAPPR